MAQLRSEAGDVCADDLVWGVRWLFSQTELRPRLSPAPLPYGEALPVLLEVHEELGVIAADAWHLPLEVREVIADHHGAPGSALTALVREVDRPCRERSAP